MADPVEHKKVAGTSFHVRDCYVWAEIYYLDSPTDYREYLPRGSGFGELVMLDPCQASPHSKARGFPVLATCIVLSLVLLAEYFVYMVADGF
jgi:hypothetical protein